MGRSAPSLLTVLFGGGGIVIAALTIDSVPSRYLVVALACTLTTSVPWVFFFG